MSKLIECDTDRGQLTRDINVPDPVNARDEVNKNYVDNYKYNAIYDHFFGNLSGNWITNVNTGILITPGAVTSNTDVAQDAFGIVTMDTGNQANGFAAITTGQNMTMLGVYSAHSFGGRFKIPVLSTSAQRFVIRIGLTDAVTGSGDPTNGIYLRYTDNINGGSIQLVCRRAGTETVYSSAFVTPVNTWINFRVFIAADLSSVGLYLDDGQDKAVLLGSVTGSGALPATTTVLGFQARITKTVGGTQRSFQSDLYFYDIRNIVPPAV